MLSVGFFFVLVAGSIAAGTLVFLRTRHWRRRETAAPEAAASKVPFQIDLPAAQPETPGNPLDQARDSEPAGAPESLAVERGKGDAVCHTRDAELPEVLPDGADAPEPPTPQVLPCHAEESVGTLEPKHDDAVFLPAAADAATGDAIAVVAIVPEPQAAAPARIGCLPEVSSQTAAPAAHLVIDNHSAARTSSSEGQPLLHVAPQADSIVAAKPAPRRTPTRRRPAVHRDRRGGRRAIPEAKAADTSPASSAEPLRQAEVKLRLAIDPIRRTVRK